MAALTSSVIAPLRASAAKPAAGRKVRPCFPAGGHDRARALALTAAPLCPRRGPTDRVRARGHAQADGVRPPCAGRRCRCSDAVGCPARVRRQHVRRQPHRCVTLCVRRVRAGAARQRRGSGGGGSSTMSFGLLPPYPGASRPSDAPPRRCSVREGRHLHRGGQAHRRRRRRRLQRGQRCVHAPTTCQQPQSWAWNGQTPPISAACLPACPRARRHTCPARRRGVLFARLRTHSSALASAGAITLVFLIIGSLESFRLVNDRAEKGLDTYLNKKSR